MGGCRSGATRVGGRRRLGAGAGAVSGAPGLAMSTSTSILGDDRGQGERPTVVGTAGDDVLVGTPGPDADLLSADEGDDVVRGGGGDDSLVSGGIGDDVVEGGDGDDHLDGGSGTDDCDGGAGIDTSVGCELVTGVP